MKNNESAKYTDKFEVVRVLREAVQNGDNVETQAQHIANIKDMLGRHRVYN